VTNAQGQRVTTADLNIPGAGPAVGAQPLSTYDLFVLWHYVTMMMPTPSGAGRNAAHQGPVFLPWHRLMLMLLEANIARVLGRPTFGLLLGLGAGRRVVPGGAACRCAVDRPRRHWR
jgi:tyrosinase